MLHTNHSSTETLKPTRDNNNTLFVEKNELFLILDPVLLQKITTLHE